MTIHLAYSREKHDGKVCGDPERVRMGFVLGWDSGTGTYEVIGKGRKLGELYRDRSRELGRVWIFSPRASGIFPRSVYFYSTPVQPLPCCPGKSPGEMEKNNCTIAPPLKTSEHQCNRIKKRDLPIKDLLRDVCNCHVQTDDHAWPQGEYLLIETKPKRLPRGV